MVTAEPSARAPAQAPRQKESAAAMGERAKAAQGKRGHVGGSLACQRGVDDEASPLLAALEVDAGDAEQAHAVLSSGDPSSARAKGQLPSAPAAGNAVERAVWKVTLPLDLLHHLVDVAVEHRYRTENP